MVNSLTDSPSSATALPVDATARGNATARVSSRLPIGRMRSSFVVVRST
jgi:hypothetical protein